MSDRRQIAVIGHGEDSSLNAVAERVGELLAEAGATLVCGGRGGVMASACRGAHRRAGMTVGILPGADTAESRPNSDLDVVVYTGLGQARNQLVILSAEAVIAVGGGWGTLSEIALARKQGRPVVLLRTGPILRPDGGAEDDPGLSYAQSPEEAVRLALEAASSRH